MMGIVFKDTGTALWLEFVALNLNFLNKSLENSLVVQLQFIESHF